MSEEMTRKEVIDWLYRLKSQVPTFMPKIWHEKFIKALQFAIDSLETDEAYQLEYEQPEFCKDCKWWKDSDGEYRRGCGAESICPINRREVFEGNGYCYMFEPQESEDNNADMREAADETN